MNPRINKATIAKALGWLGGAAMTLAASGAFGKYSAWVTGIGAALTGLGVHKASETSAGHPNG